MTDGFRLDAKSLKSIGLQLRDASPAIYTVMRKEMRTAGELIAERARQNAAWSSRIPMTIKTTVMNNGMTVVVKAGGGKGSTAPHARVYEHEGRAGNFKHPVFADATQTSRAWTWVTEAARPFLKPASDELLPEATAAVEAALQKAVDTLGEGV